MGCLRALRECLSSMIQSNLLCVCPRLSLTLTPVCVEPLHALDMPTARRYCPCHIAPWTPWRGATYADGSGIGAEDVSRVEVVDEPDWYGVGVAFAGTAERHAYGSGAPCDVRFRGSDTGRVEPGRRARLRFVSFRAASLSASALQGTHMHAAYGHPRWPADWTLRP